MNDNNSNNKDIPENLIPSVNAVADIHKVVPKFCTDIGMQLLTNRRNIVMTMIFNDGSSAALIDRIIVDLELIVSIKNACEQIIKDSADEE